MGRRRLGVGRSALCDSAGRTSEEGRRRVDVGVGHELVRDGAGLGRQHGRCEREAMRRMARPSTVRRGTHVDLFDRTAALA